MEDGRPYREILHDLRDRAERKGDAKRIAEMEAELASPPLPKGLEYIWRAYWRIRKRKAGNGFGSVPIEWPDIDAFVRHTRSELVPWEVEFIEVIDDLFMAEQARRSAKGRG